MVIDMQWVTILFVTLFCFTDLVFKGILLYLIINIRVSIDTMVLLSRYLIKNNSMGDNEQ